MNTEPGQSKFAKIMQKKMEILESREVKPETAKTVEKKHELVEKDIVLNPVNITPVENKVDITDGSNEKEVIVNNTQEEFLNPKMQEFVKQIIQQVHESADPKILRRHTGYKGPRVKRSYAFRVDQENWLINICNTHHLDKTQVLEDALSAYLPVKYPDCKP